MYGCSDRYTLHPVILFVISDEAKECLDPLICVLQLSVCSGMIRCGYVLFDSHQPTQLPCELGCELRVSIAHDLAGQPKVGNHVFEVQ